MRKFLTILILFISLVTAYGQSGHLGKNWAIGFDVETGVKYARVINRLRSKNYIYPSTNKDYRNLASKMTISYSINRAIVLFSKVGINNGTIGLFKPNLDNLYYSDSFDEITCSFKGFNYGLGAEYFFLKTPYLGPSIFARYSQYQLSITRDNETFSKKDFPTSETPYRLELGYQDNKILIDKIRIHYGVSLGIVKRKGATNIIYLGKQGYSNQEYIYNFQDLSRYIMYTRHNWNFNFGINYLL